MTNESSRQDNDVKNAELSERTQQQVRPVAYSIPIQELLLSLVLDVVVKCVLAL